MFRFRPGAHREIGRGSEADKRPLTLLKSSMHNGKPSLKGDQGKTTIYTEKVSEERKLMLGRC